MKPVIFRACDVTKNIEGEITVPVILKGLWRLKLGVKVMKLGAWIAGLGLFTVNDQSEATPETR